MAEKSDLEIAQSLKEEGNEAMTANDYTLAIDKYTAAIAKAPKREFYSNLSLAYLKHGDIEAALLNGKQARSLDPAWWRAHYRIAAALEQQHKLWDAREAYYKAFELADGQDGGDSNLKKESDMLKVKLTELSTRIVADAESKTAVETEEASEPKSKRSKVHETDKTDKTDTTTPSGSGQTAERELVNSLLTMATHTPPAGNPVPRRLQRSSPLVPRIADTTPSATPTAMPKPKASTPGSQSDHAPFQVDADSVSSAHVAGTRNSSQHELQMIFNSVNRGLAELTNAKSRLMRRYRLGTAAESRESRASARRRPAKADGASPSAAKKAAHSGLTDVMKVMSDMFGPGAAFSMDGDGAYRPWEVQARSPSGTPTAATAAATTATGRLPLGFTPNFDDSAVQAHWRTIMSTPAPDGDALSKLAYPLPPAVLTSLKGAVTARVLALDVLASLHFEHVKAGVAFDANQPTDTLELALATATAQAAAARLLILNDKVLTSVSNAHSLSKPGALTALFALLQATAEPTVLFLDDNAMFAVEHGGMMASLLTFLKLPATKTVCLLGTGQDSASKPKEQSEDAMVGSFLMDLESFGMRNNRPGKGAKTKAKAKPTSRYAARSKAKSKKERPTRRNRLYRLPGDDESMLRMGDDDDNIDNVDEQSDTIPTSTPEQQTELVALLDSVSLEAPSDTAAASLFAKRLLEDTRARRLLDNLTGLRACVLQVGIACPGLLEDDDKEDKSDKPVREAVTAKTEVSSDDKADKMDAQADEASPSVKPSLLVERALLHDYLASKALVPADLEGLVYDAVRRHLGQCPEPVRDTAQRVVVPLGALTAALKHHLKLDKPPSGPAHRTPEELSALAENSHEEGILSLVVDAGDVKTPWESVGGLATVKELLKENTVYPLRYPELFQEGSAGQATKGVLLFGPPGTGKTLMAKAVATETGATFINVDSASISSKWYGEAEKMARAVFTLARKLAPTVIFIDEIDSLLSARDDTERSTIASVKTTLMREWDGLGTGADRVLVIGATNRPYVLDEAILRRMPRRIMVDLPMVDERVAILKVGLEGNRLGPDVDLKELAGKLEQYSGSDIRELCREAIVSISNARARELEELEAKGETVPEGMLRLRAAKMADFEEAMKRIRPSVPKDSSMRKRVQEWNEQFGEGGTGKHASLDHIYS